jgi:hypothetical protein
MSVAVSSNGNGHAGASGVIWPFGRYKGLPSLQLNSGYLRWVIGGDGWDPDRLADVHDELDRRALANAKHGGYTAGTPSLTEVLAFHERSYAHPVRHGAGRSVRG